MYDIIIIIIRTVHKIIINYTENYMITYSFNIIVLTTVDLNYIQTFYNRIFFLYVKEGVIGKSGLEDWNAAGIDEFLMIMTDLT